MATAVQLEDADVMIVDDVIMIDDDLQKISPEIKLIGPEGEELPVDDNVQPAKMRRTRLVFETFLSFSLKKNCFLSVSTF